MHLNFSVSLGKDLSSWGTTSRVKVRLGNSVLNMGADNHFTTDPSDELYDEKTCGSCGRELEMVWNYCPQCGLEISSIDWRDRPI